MHETVYCSSLQWWWIWSPLSWAVSLFHAFIIRARPLLENCVKVQVHFVRWVSILHNCLQRALTGLWGATLVFYLTSQTLLQPGALHGTVVTQMQHPVFGLVEPATVYIHGYAFDKNQVFYANCHFSCLAFFVAWLCPVTWFFDLNVVIDAYNCVLQTCSALRW